MGTSICGYKGFPQNPRPSIPYSDDSTVTVVFWWLTLLFNLIFCCCLFWGYSSHLRIFHSFWDKISYEHYIYEYVYIGTCTYLQVANGNPERWRNYSTIPERLSDLKTHWYQYYQKEHVTSIFNRHWCQNCQEEQQRQTAVIVGH